MVVEQAKRLVESHYDGVILLESIPGWGAPPVPWSPLVARFCQAAQNACSPHRMQVRETLTRRSTCRAVHGLSSARSAGCPS